MVINLYEANQVRSPVTDHQVYSSILLIAYKPYVMNRIKNKDNYYRVDLWLRESNIQTAIEFAYRKIV